MTFPDPIPVADPHAQYVASARDIGDAIQRVLDSGRYILGYEVEAFEQEFAVFLEAPHCIAVANGTDALALALKACGIVPGDEVITVANTAVATVAAIEQIGACPVFVDIDPATRCMDASKIKPLITKRTRALLPVHLYGYPIEMTEIREIADACNLYIVEDCAQALGAVIGHGQAGTFGDAAAFSFYPTKNLGAIGDAGAVVTRREEIAQRLRQLRQYGWDASRNCQIQGINSRMDEIQAAILRVKLTRLSAELVRRGDIAQRFTDSIRTDTLTPPPVPPHGQSAVHLYVVETLERDAFQRHCQKAGIATAVHYPVPIHFQPAYRNRLRGGDELQQTEGLCERIVTLPFYPQLTEAQIDRICEALHQWNQR